MLFSFLRGQKRGYILKLMEDCAQCARLWREYSAATTEHIMLQGKLRIAALAHDQDLITTLTPKVEEAAEKRATMRNAIKVHKREAHSAAAEA